MPNTVDVTCKIIPLYRVRIMYDPDPHKQHDDYYERHIVADSIEGLIQGIADIEIDYDENLEEDGRRMLFDITDFLLMPCEIAEYGRSYHLFDIDEVDCGGWYGSSIDNIIYYYTYFSSEKHPEPGVRDRELSKFAEPLPVMGTIPKHGSEIKDFRRTLAEEEATMDAIYKLARQSDYFAMRLHEKVKRNGELDARAMASVTEWHERENRQAEFIKMLDEMIVSFKSKEPFKPNYGKKPEMHLEHRLSNMIEPSKLSDYNDFGHASEM